MENIRYYSDLDSYLNENLDNKNEQFLLVAENSNFDLKKLQDTNMKFYGAVVPSVIFEEQYSNTAIVSADLKDCSEVFFIKDMMNFELNKDKFNSFDSMTVILDGLSPNITNFLETLFQSLPENSEIIGGGAGKLTLKQEPVIFSNEGIYQDAALLVASESKLNVGVQNGWEFLAGPFIASSAEKNILKSLNFQNAFETYKAIVEEDSGMTFNEDNFFDISKAYPFGIVKFNKEIIVRDPIAKDENGHMVLVGDIEQNSTVNILKGDKNSLIASSAKAVEIALDCAKKDELCTFNDVMIFDCISRSIFLEEDFSKELAVVKKEIKNKKLFGALTLGEIANNGNEYINFYNKTCVVGVLC